MLGIFGAAGLSVAAVERRSTGSTAASADGFPFGFNLIHSPNEPALEAAIVDLYLRRGVRLVEASAFLDLTLPVVRYRVTGIHRDAAGEIVAPNRIIAKVSRVEVASKFLAPPPERILRELVAAGRDQPGAGRLGGTHPDGRGPDGRGRLRRPHRQPAGDRPACRRCWPCATGCRRSTGYDRPLRVGAAGGISTPWSAAAALAMGAAYLVTGSVNQSCVEAGTSDAVRRMLAQAQQADIAMAPAADMFEMGVKVQVLKRGTMFAMRAAKLYELYRTHDSLEQIPATGPGTAREDALPRAPRGDLGADTRVTSRTATRRRSSAPSATPSTRWPWSSAGISGQSSHWANAGEPSRTVDYQIWCGPAMAAFNEWVRGSFLEQPENRRVVTVAPEHPVRRRRADPRPACSRPRA